ncbi:MAG: hypothetical protein V7L01_30805 [Nostoc sp.]|uniref:hypothetical protein n=1 Tax=Nostoc sp. TaxID=1180 RepID=UPI002FFC27CF
MGGAVDFFVGYGIDAVNAIAQGIPKITVAASNFPEYGIILSDAAEKQGIGAMSDASWKSLFDSMVDTKISKSNVNYKKAHTLQFANKGVGYYKK